MNHLNTAFFSAFGLGLGCLLFLTGCIGESKSVEMSPPAASTPDVPPAADPSTVEPKSDTPSMNGTWAATLATLSGSPFPSTVTESITLTLSGDQYEIKVGENPDRGTCAINSSTTPIQLTIQGTEGPNAGKTLLAICDFPDPLQMRVCYDMTGSAFPQAFDSTAENGYFFVVYSRVK